jgi:hypothetical protein
MIPFILFDLFSPISKSMPTQYNWNIIESGIKHHKTNQPI